ncbi:hypothetical protein TNCV_1815481 [Trichonephila clavipes]|nr:hypothetical protein TNCV_1815481 [Trichonephila clavipes]
MYPETSGVVIRIQMETELITKDYISLVSPVSRWSSPVPLQSDFMVYMCENSTTAVLTPISASLMLSCQLRPITASFSSRFFNSSNQPPSN